MAESIWVGKDEHEGVPAQRRKDLEPPPHWRLEAIAQTPRPHSLSARGGKAVFIEAAAETSDVWLLDLEAGGPPERLPAGRARGSRSPTGPTRRPGCRLTARPSPTRTATACGWWPPPAGRRASWSR